MWSIERRNDVARFLSLLLNKKRYPPIIEKTRDAPEMHIRRNKGAIVMLCTIAGIGTTMIVCNKQG